jgi:hypothetical protein
VTGGPSTSTGAGTSWRLFPPAGLGGISRRLEDVAVVAPSNIVAVGHTPSNAHIERYDGLRWTTEVDAAMQEGSAELWAVSATSAGALWAVGDFVYQPKPVAERYTGHGWVLKPPTNIGAKPNELEGVSALSATSAFAVGNYTVSGGTRRALAGGSSTDRGPRSSRPTPRHSTTSSSRWPRSRRRTSGRWGTPRRTPREPAGSP